MGRPCFGLPSIRWATLVAPSLLMIPLAARVIAQESPLGALRGTITVSGAEGPGFDMFPPPRPIPGAAPLEIDPKTSGLANVIVFLTRVPAGANVPPPPAAPATLTIAGSAFAPHILAVRAGQPIIVTNTDQRPQNIHPMTMRNDGINRVLAPGESFRFAYAKSEPLPIYVKNDFIVASEDYHLIMEHPWFAVTDAQGNFRIDDLPPGRHAFRIWHERAGYLDRGYVVLIAAGRTIEVVEEYPIEMFLPGPRGSGGSRSSHEIGPFDLSGAENDTALATARRLLAFSLRKKIKATDRICALTHEQRRKLELAGNGDIERLLEQIAELRDKYASLRGTPERL